MINQKDKTILHGLAVIFALIFPENSLIDGNVFYM